MIQAEKYLRDVIEHKRAVPFYIYKGGIGRSAQGKGFKTPQVRWPKKSCLYLLDLLENAKSNANVRKLDVGSLVISHIQVNSAPRGRRRTNRAHGRINAYMSSPSHIEMILTEKEDAVTKGAELPEKKKKISQKKKKRERAQNVPFDD